jgi:hypothetical protein
MGIFGEVHYPRFMGGHRCYSTWGSRFTLAILCMQLTICGSKEANVWRRLKEPPGELSFELGRAWAAGCLGGRFLGVERTNGFGRQRGEVQ